MRYLKKREFSFINMSSRNSTALVPQKLLSNTFTMNFKKKTFKYSIELDPVPEKDSLRIIGKCLRTNRETIYEKYGNSYIFINNAIYSPNASDNLDLKVTYDDVEYAVKSNFI
jgi:hypothetical protein